MGIAAAIAGGLAVGAGSSLIGSAASKKDRQSARRLTDAQTEATQQQAQIAQDQWDRYLSVYGPLESQLSGEVSTLGGEADQERAAAEAKSGVAQAYKTGNERIQRDLVEGLGANPGDPFYKNALASSYLAESGAMGGADYQAREAARLGGRSARYAMVQAGRGIPAASMAGLGAASNAYGSQAGAAFDRAGQQAAAAGQLTYPVMKAVQSGVQNWWGAQNPSAAVPQGVQFNSNQTGLYGDTAQMVGLAKGDTAQMVGLAKGGIVREPTVAMMAEEGEPEAVLNPGATAMLGAKKIEQLNRAGMAHMAKEGAKRRSERVRVSLAA